MVVETEGVAQFMESDLCQPLDEEFFRGIILHERMDAGCCSRQPKVGVSKEEVVTAGGNDVLFGDPHCRNLPLLASIVGLPEEDIRGNALPARPEAGAFVHNGGLDDAGN